MPRTPSPIAWNASSVEMELTQSTILLCVMACFMSLSTAKEISGVKSIRTRSGEPIDICSIRLLTDPQVGSSSKPST
jgi:hypothetical protein